jgi:hypothetical protein
MICTWLGSSLTFFSPLKLPIQSLNWTFRSLSPTCLLRMPR